MSEGDTDEQNDTDTDCQRCAAAVPGRYALSHQADQGPDENLQHCEYCCLSPLVCCWSHPLYQLTDDLIQLTDDLIQLTDDLISSLLAVR